LGILASIGMICVFACSSSLVGGVHYVLTMFCVGAVGGDGDDKAVTPNRAKSTWSVFLYIICHIYLYNLPSSQQIMSYTTHYKLT